MSSTKQFARENGYTGDSPAMLATFEKIRQIGVREARTAHYQRKAIVDRFKASPAAFFSMMGDALSIDEALQEANRYVSLFRNMPTWRQANRRAEILRAKQMRVYARFFRRYGALVWAQEAAWCARAIAAKADAALTEIRQTKKETADV